MANDKYAVRLANDCFASCGRLESAMLGKDAGNLSELEKAVIRDLQV